ncbi:heavy metal translocating P-type ATPase [Microbacterium sp.]|uniref:heavy metal translocating P-type ATPase n=1 Tax=Microbacterium sp. TaxID=51671 RepID=UPI00334072B0
MSDGAHTHRGHVNVELIFAISACACYLLGLFAELVRVDAVLATALFACTYFFGGFFAVRSAVGSVRRGRFEVDFLMLIAALGAAAIGRWAEGAVLLALFSIGHALEEHAMRRAKRSIESLADLAPTLATVRRDGRERVVPAEEVVVGDLVVVRPDARFPVDGTVVAGRSAVDQSPITGESIPVEKQPIAEGEEARPGRSVPPASHVFAGTINGPGLLEIVATANTGDSTLARVVRLVQSSEGRRSSTQLLLDRFQRRYVLVIVAIVTVTFLAGLFLGEAFPDAFSRAMVVLVAGSPCALAIATPAAILAGVSRAARAGLLVKGGAPLELIGRVQAIAFDKTGTLTQGKPVLAETVLLAGASRAMVEEAAFAVETASDHPLAGAVVRGLEGRIGAVPAASDVRSVTGRGVRGMVDGRTVLVGSARFLADEGIAASEELDAAVADLYARGMTVLVVAIDARPQAVLGLLDAPRAEAREVLTMLRAQGIGDLVMLSGDNQRVADAVAGSIGVDRAIGGLLPEGKVVEIERLGTGGRTTAMLGDGVNDAPAMTRASVGIAMGAAGSAVALETADVAVMSDDIGRIPYLIRLSRAVNRVVRQNLVISFAVVAVLVPLSVLGLAEMGPVIFIHEGSTVLIIANALRLLRYEAGNEHAGVVHEP